MPQIIPIRDLKKTSEISALCKDAKEPVFITKNGYGDMVIMSMETYERQMALVEVYKKLAEAEAELANDTPLLKAEDVFRKLGAKYGRQGI